ncbi:hypothetical protein NF212_00055 [Parasalinivibrio latis]|uniref:hypothetical protein n=1 Tax=Parasalinivibrio latis TaxID=2952610 RepID=UPI0030E309BC
MARFLAISPQSQFWLFHCALALNILGMVLTDMWEPMVVGAIVTLYLSIDALIRVRYVLPMKKGMRELQHENERLKKELANQQSETVY